LLKAVYLTGVRPDCEGLLMARSESIDSRISRKGAIFSRKSMVNPWGIEEVPSFPPAQTREENREAYTNHLMERVISRGNPASGTAQPTAGQHHAGRSGQRTFKPSSSIRPVRGRL